MRKVKAVVLLLTVSLVLQFAIPAAGVRAEESKSVSEIIDEIIESDKQTLGNLSPALEKAYEKLVSLFKSIGQLSKKVKKVVTMYNNLDEEAEDYPEKVLAFFNEYEKLGVVNRKLVNLITGVLDAKDKIKQQVKRIVVVDLYSSKDIEPSLEGVLRYTSENKEIATVAGGTVSTVNVGMTKITVTNQDNQEVFRVFVKKPVLSVKLNVKKGSSISIPLPSGYCEIKVSNKDIIDAENSGAELTVMGISKGTGYIYVGSGTGSTTKYKIKVK